MPDSADEMPNGGNKVPNNCKIMPNSSIKMPDSEQEQLIYKYVLENESITTNKVMELLNVKQRRSRAVLQSMVEKGWLKKMGVARSTVYVKSSATVVRHSRKTSNH